MEKTLFPYKRPLRLQMEFIEFKLYWEKEINRNDLMDHFDISRPQASILIKKYQDMAPGNMEYDLSRKRYVRTRSFTPRLISVSAESFFSHLLQSGREGSSLPSFVDSSLTCTVVSPLERKLEPAVVQSIVEAIKHHYSVIIYYQSMSRERPTKRLVSPHTFVFDGNRWHMRAYCHASTSFRDFVLIRIIHVAGKEEIYVGPEEDRMWQEDVEISIAPHPGLSPTQRQIIERDFGMEKGCRKVTVRKALAFYFLQRMNLLGHPESSPAQTQQIVLADKDSLSGWVAGIE